MTLGLKLFCVIAISIGVSFMIIMISSNKANVEQYPPQTVIVSSEFGQTEIKKVVKVVTIRSFQTPQYQYDSIILSILDDNSIVYYMEFLKEHGAYTIEREYIIRGGKVIWQHKD